MGIGGSACPSRARRRARTQRRGNPGANLKSISHRCYLFDVAFVWELTKETIHLPLSCLQGGEAHNLREEDGAHENDGSRRGPPQI